MLVRKRRLPHWEIEAATYSVTFRLADSLPASVLQAYEFERRDIIQTASQQGRKLTQQEIQRLDQLFSERIDRYLDSGAGACHLARPDIAELVANALKYFDGERYCLHAWCVMPNHVHTVFTILPAGSLDGILHSWKSFTSKEANKLLGTTGTFWQREYYDRLIRDADEFRSFVNYTVENPVRAGLRNWKWVWRAEAARSSGA
jgi:REP element-mobilizing transposase RayT